MKPKFIFLVIFLTTIFLILLCILINKKDSISFKNFNTIINTPIPIPILKKVNRVCVMKKSLPQIQNEIDTILVKQPIIFLDNNYSLTKESNKTLDSIVSIIKQIDNNIVIKIISYSDSNRSRIYNRILTQKRSDAISSYIKNRYSVRFIYSIGYGKEFLFSKDNNGTMGTHTEIYLKRIRNDF